MQRAEHQVPRLGGGDGRADRRQVAHFSDHHHVRVLTQSAAERLGEVGHVHAHFALHHDRLLVRVVILDRVFHGDDVPIEVLVDVVDHRRQRGRLAGPGRPGHQEDSARSAADLLGHFRQADLLEGKDLVGDLAEHDRTEALLLENRHAEPRLFAVGEPEVA